MITHSALSSSYCGSVYDLWQIQPFALSIRCSNPLSYSKTNVITRRIRNAGCVKYNDDKSCARYIVFLRGSHGELEY